MGQKLYLQKDAAERAAANADNNIRGTEIAKVEQALPVVNTPATTSVKHIVQNKETLFGIARKYGVEVDQVRSWNRLQNDAIRSGQELLIYKN